jgi:hypothetical protein
MVIYMSHESVLILNDIEKQIIDELIQKLNNEEIPAQGRYIGEHDMDQISYEYHSRQGEKIIHGSLLGCPYKLRFVNRNRIFFSAWDSKDVCSIFYDMIAIIHLLTKHDLHVVDLCLPFDVDLHTEAYVFLTGEIAGSFVLIADQLCREVHKIIYNSQYILSVYDDSDDCRYNALIQQLKTEGYSKIQILQVWIRGEILYYAAADGVVLRSRAQRILTHKEEEDLVRKITKSVNDQFRHVKL